MGIDFNKYDKMVRDAVAHYWATLDEQGTKQSDGDADRGNRSKVTGGKQMNGFCQIVASIAEEAGLTKHEILSSGHLDLPGYFRPTKKWDFLIIDSLPDRKHLVAAIEFKSIASSFGKNMNNRSEEAIGSAKDIRIAYDEGAFGDRPLPAPWIGWMMLFIDNPESTKPRKPSQRFFKVMKGFEQASYMKRCEILVRRLVSQRLYDSGALITCTEVEAKTGKYNEPAGDLGMHTFLTSLYGHIGTYLAAKGAR